MILSTSTSEPLETITYMADQIINGTLPHIVEIRQEPCSVNPVLLHPHFDDRLMELLEADCSLTAKVRTTLKTFMQASTRSTT